MAITAANATPINSAKDGHTVRLRLTDTAIASPTASPLTTLVVTNAVLQGVTPRGPLRRLFRARDEAVPPLTAAALTQAQARALLDSRDSSPTTPTVLTTSRVPRATISIQPLMVSGTGSRQWAHDVSVDASGRPTILVMAKCARPGATSAGSGASAAQAYLTIRFEHSLTGR